MAKYQLFLDVRFFVLWIIVCISKHLKTDANSFKKKIDVSWSLALALPSRSCSRADTQLEVETRALLLEDDVARTGPRMLSTTNTVLPADSFTRGRCKVLGAQHSGRVKAPDYAVLRSVPCVPPTSSSADSFMQWLFSVSGFLLGQFSFLPHQSCYFILVHDSIQPICHLSLGPCFSTARTNLSFFLFSSLVQGFFSLSIFFLLCYYLNFFCIFI
jgi:hypothetical protein